MRMSSTWATPPTSAPDTRRCARSLPELNVLGGCCGTDHRHVRAIVASWS